MYKDKRRLRPVTNAAAGKDLVVIAAQIDGTRIGRIRLRRVPDASAKSLEDAIREGVEPGSAVRTDGWKGYNGLNRIDHIHDVVREEATEYPHILKALPFMLLLLGTNPTMLDVPPRCQRMG